MSDGQVPRKRRNPELIVVTETLDKYGDLVEAGREAAQAGSESCWRLGDLAAKVEKAQGRPGGGLKQYAKDIGADHGTLKIYRTIALAFPKVNRLAKLPYSHYQTAYYHCNKGRDGEPDIGAALGWLKRADDAGLSKRQLAAAIDDARNDAILKSVDQLPDGRYRCIVVDPPWPYKAGLRLDDRPDLEGFDYPQMTLEEIQSLDIGRIAHDDCHLFLWATQRALRDAFEVLDAWGFNHRCTLVWHKNGGHTPIEVGFMYNAEFVLYATKGNLPLMKVGEKVCFEGKRRRHSQKPDEFYDIVRRVSPPPRIDVFSREPHDGFDGWGAEYNPANGEPGGRSP